MADLGSLLSAYTTDRPAMTIAVELGRKATKQTKKKHFSRYCINLDFTF